MFHVDPESATGAAIRANEALGSASEAWRTLEGPLVRPRDLGWWHVLRARESLLRIVPASDHAAAFRAWMIARAREWTDTGVASRLAALEH